MKQKLLIILSLIVLVLAGCGKPADQVLNVKDTEAIHKFINENINKVTAEEFKDFIPFYIDLNKDGNMDVIYNTKEWYGDLIFILGTDSGYKLISADKSEIHKFADFNVQNEFLVATGEHIFNDYNDKRTEIYYYNDNKLGLLGSFTTESLASAPPYQWSGTGKITLVDSYNHIEYSYEESEENLSNNSKAIVKRINLLYKLENSSYTETENGENFSKDLYITKDNKSQETSASTVELTDISNGYKIDEFTITNIEHAPQRGSTSFSLVGKKWVKGKIYYDMFYESYCFTMSEKLLNTGIKYGSELDNYFTTFDQLNCAHIINEKEILGKLTLAQLNHLKNDNDLEVSAQIENPMVTTCYGSEGSENITILDFNITNSSSIAAYEVPLISGFDSETINNVYLDYSQYKCVIIPSLDTINRKKLEFTKLHMTHDDKTSVRFTIFGTLHDVKITYTDYMGDSGTTETFDSLSNTYVSLRAPFNTDMSVITIEGKVYLNGTEYEEVSFTLDKMRDKTDYEILTYK